MLGLAAKAGKLVFGAELGMKAVVDGRAKLVIAAADASENVREEFCYRCQTRSLPYLEYGTKFDLGQAVGKPPKAVVCVTDCHFADGIQNIYGGVK